MDNVLLEISEKSQIPVTTGGVGDPLDAVQLFNIA